MRTILRRGAVLFKLQPNIAYVNDINSELIQMYEVIRDNVDELIIALGEHPNEEDHFIVFEIGIEIRNSMDN